MRQSGTTTRNIFVKNLWNLWNAGMRNSSMGTFSNSITAYHYIMIIILYALNALNSKISTILIN